MVERLAKTNENSETIDPSSGRTQRLISVSSIESGGPLLNQYDETSMQQVNSLISDFQKVCLRSDAN